MYGGYYVGLPPDEGDNWTHYYHNGALYSDPRISAYIGMGLHQMPGNVWWRSWRELPPPAPFADCQSDRSGLLVAGAVADGRLVADLSPIRSPHSSSRCGRATTRTPARISVHPDVGRRHVRGADGQRGRARDEWGPSSFGLADARTAQVQINYATRAACLSGLGHVAVEHRR